MQLTEEQKNVVRQVMQSFDKEPYITVSGYAGTGKSTIIGTVTQALKNKGLNFGIGAYTGKAANVLRKKGLGASTIHSMI